MTDLRALRLAIEKKFNERRDLIMQNGNLRSENYRLERQLDATHKIVHSKLGQYALDDCADRIVMMVLDQAFEASRLVAEQVASNGDYMVGIDTPSQHVRYRLARMDLLESLDFDGLATDQIRHVHVKTNPAI